MDFNALTPENSELFVAYYLLFVKTVKMKKKIKVDVVSDVVCPWCYVGKRRLERAMAELSGDMDFDITYLPFELNPEMPTEGKNLKEHLTAKFGGADKFHSITENMKQVALTEGLHFDFDKQTTSPNTRNAHRIIWLAGKSGLQVAVKEALLHAYFEEGIDLTPLDNLIRVVAQAGLPSDDVKQLLASNEGVAEVERLEQINYHRGISGVPFYIVNNKYGLSGAQPSDTFVRLFKKASEEILEEK